MGSTCWVRLFLRPLPSDTPLIDSVTADDQVKAYIKKIMSQLNKWMVGGKISKLVVVITSKETGEHIERWQFDVQIFGKHSKSKSSRSSGDKENAGPTYVLLHIYSWQISASNAVSTEMPSLRLKRPKRKSKTKFKPSSDRSPLP